MDTCAQIRSWRQAWCTAAPYALSLLLASACASFGGSRPYTLTTTPAGADVLSATGEILGKTPLTLAPEMLDRLAPEGILQTTVRKRGYFPLRLVVPVRTVTTQEIPLQALDPALFQSEILGVYGDRFNEFGRLLLETQGALATKKIPTAEKMLESLGKIYGGVPIVQVLRANLLLLQGNRKEARFLLEQAADSMPDDASLHRLLQHAPAETVPSGVKP